MNAKVHIFQNVYLESRLLEMNRLQIEKIYFFPPHQFHGCVAKKNQKNNAVKMQIVYSVCKLCEKKIMGKDLQNLQRFTKES